MNDSGHRAFRVDPIDYTDGLPQLRAVRETVFVQEQQVPIEEEWDALDPDCVHVIARAQDGTPIGTGRLTPEHKIGRMAVLREWRGRGVGDALLLTLIEQAHQRGWREVALNAQVSAIAFYLRHGFQPVGERFWEAGIEHQAMRRALTARDAQRIAAAAELDGTLYTSLSQAGRDAVFALIEAGHYQMLVDEDE